MLHTLALSHLALKLIQQMSSPYQPSSQGVIFLFKHQLPGMYLIVLFHLPGYFLFICPVPCGYISPYWPGWYTYSTVTVRLKTSSRQETRTKVPDDRAWGGLDPPPVGPAWQHQSATWQQPSPLAQRGLFSHTPAPGIWAVEAGQDICKKYLWT